MHLYVGTSGYSYKEWKGIFYPETLPATRMLQFYGQHFAAVEINNTFYRMPKAAVLETWAEAVPSHFKFVLKAPQRITHFQRLKNARDSVSYFLDVAGLLGPRLGPVLFQLPPDAKKDFAILQDFLGCLPPDRRSAFEFRHPSWFDSEVYAVLRDHNAALCVAETGDTLELPGLASADWGYLRLRRPDYGRAELSAWIQRIQEQHWREVFVFFKHEDEARGPKFARQFLDLVAQQPAADLKAA